MDLNDSILTSSDHPTLGPESHRTVNPRTRHPKPALADRAVIDGILKDLSSNKGGFKDLVRAVVLSESFSKN